MILTGPKIAAKVKDSEIVIEPFNLDQVNPNSYDFRLGNKLLVYKEKTLDSRQKNETTEIVIPEEGIVLEPDRIYLGHSIEKIGSKLFVPILRGKSSTGRLGIFVHITADLIDIGSVGQFTLMMHAVQPVRVYPGMLIGQVTFWKTLGKISLYKGKYQGSVGPQASQVFKDFEK